MKVLDSRINDPATDVPGKHSVSYRHHIDLTMMKLRESVLLIGDVSNSSQHTQCRQI